VLDNESALEPMRATDSTHGDQLILSQRSRE
jgi:hypothetical protein